MPLPLRFCVPNPCPNNRVPIGSNCVPKSDSLHIQKSVYLMILEMKDTYLGME